MIAFFAAVVAFVLMFVFGTRPIARIFGEICVWQVLLIDLVVAACVFGIMW